MQENSANLLYSLATKPYFNILQDKRWLQMIAGYFLRRKEMKLRWSWRLEILLAWFEKRKRNFLQTTFRCRIHYVMWLLFVKRLGFFLSFMKSLFKRMSKKNFRIIFDLLQHFWEEKKGFISKIKHLCTQSVSQNWFYNKNI